MSFSEREKQEVYDPFPEEQSNKDLSDASGKFAYHTIITKMKTKRFKEFSKVLRKGLWHAILVLSFWTLDKRIMYPWDFLH